MIRLWLVCRHFDKLHGRRGGDLQYYDNKVPTHEFINHLLNERVLGEDLRETLKRPIFYLTGRWIFQGGKGMYRSQKRRRLVFDLIAEAQKRQYLIEENEKGLNSTLHMDSSGRNFMKPLTFIEACAKEYPGVWSLLVAFLSGIGITVLYSKGVEWLVDVL